MPPGDNALQKIIYLRDTVNIQKPLMAACGDLYWICEMLLWAVEIQHCIIRRTLIWEIIDTFVAGEDLVALCRLFQCDTT